MQGDEWGIQETLKRARSVAKEVADRARQVADAGLESAAEAAAAAAEQVGGGGATGICFALCAVCLALCPWGSRCEPTRCGAPFPYYNWGLARFGGGGRVSPACSLCI